MRLVLAGVLGAGLMLVVDLPAVEAQAPALNTPPALPLDSAAYGATRFRFTALLQVRADFPENNPTRTSTFFLLSAHFAGIHLPEPASSLF